MYPRISDLFTRHLGHSRESVKTDTRIDSGGRPDAAVSPKDASGIEIPNWIVVEAKDERDVFKSLPTTEPIVKEKWKYVGLSTAFFVFLDPGTVRIRPVFGPHSETDAAGDIVVPTAELADRARFLEVFKDLSYDATSLDLRLQAFRDGDPGSFAYIKVHDDPAARSYLASGLTQAVALLRRAVVAAWEEFAPEVADVRDQIAAFTAVHGTLALLPDRVARPTTFVPDNPSAYRSALNALNRRLRRSERVRAAYRIVSEALPRAAQQVSDDGEKGVRQAIDLVSEETVALLLSRILLLRFFEDHEFFADKRYLCNGGLHSLRLSMEYFKDSYARVLKRAYEAGGDIYGDVFEDRSLDWILASRSDHFSRLLERALFILAAFDFSTVREDILTIVYASFYSAHQRKTKGEHYTPPSIARWILQRIDREIGLDQRSRIFDPACGLGTFVVEAFKVGIGAYLARGGTTADYRNVVGNDINPVSAAFARMQLLWTLLGSNGGAAAAIPEIAVLGGHDSIAGTTMTDLMGEDDVSPFVEIDNAQYRAVVGNPPYVRPERRPFRLTQAQIEAFKPFSAKSNLYVLFLIKSLRQWVADDGMLGFVIPKSFLTGRDAGLRADLQVGGKYRVVEIVDFEEVAADVFPDAAVIPIVILIQKRSATAADTVTLRVVTPREATRARAGKVAEFDLDAAPSSSVPYPDIFSADGRIISRINPARLALAARLTALGTVRTIAQPRPPKAQRADGTASFLEDAHA